MALSIGFIFMATRDDVTLRDARAYIEAALALTRSDCTEANAPPSTLSAWNQWRLDVLARADSPEAPAYLSSRARLRRVEALAYLAWHAHRSGDEDSGGRLAGEAIRQLALVERNTLADEDKNAYEQAALRASAVRWAADSGARTVATKSGLSVDVKPGKPGESCLRRAVDSAGRPARTKPPSRRRTAWWFRHPISWR